MIDYLVSRIKSQTIKSFIRSEDGAVTVDFVVLCAAVVVMGGFLGRAMNTEIKDGVESLDISSVVTDTINQ